MIFSSAFPSSPWPLLKRKPPRMVPVSQGSLGREDMAEATCGFSVVSPLSVFVAARGPPLKLEEDRSFIYTANNIKQQPIQQLYQEKAEQDNYTIANISSDLIYQGKLQHFTSLNSSAIKGDDFPVKKTLIYLQIINSFEGFVTNYTIINHGITILLLTPATISFLSYSLCQW